MGTKAQTKAIITMAAAICLAVSPVLRAQITGTPDGVQPMYSHASQGYLGVDIRDVVDEQVSALKLKDTHGAEIITVDHDAPAGKVGLREHDVILQVDTTVVENAEHFRRIMHETPAGRTIKLVISRDGQQQTITVQLANRREVEQRVWQDHYVPPPPPDDNDAQSSPPQGSLHGNGFAGGEGVLGELGGVFFDEPLIGSHATYTGAMLEPVGQLADYFGVKPGLGLLVKNIDADSPAANAGLKPGDIVVRVNTTDIVRPDDWIHAVRQAKGKPMQLTIVRNKQQQSVTLTPIKYHPGHHGLLEGMPALPQPDANGALDPAQMDAFLNAMNARFAETIANMNAEMDMLEQN